MRAFAPILIGCAAVSLMTTDVHACGDKFLLVGRGVAFRRAYAACIRTIVVRAATAERRQSDPGIRGFRRI
jgi:hypothetical protein